jgi:hypothetical protein
MLSVIRECYENYVFLDMKRIPNLEFLGLR